ncbi:MAG: hypothetical protein JWM59_3258 [Verrucomicrobiales bacterium]|nr:hypothetical protein [Verrucomicrobiales bacterium]
MKKILLILILAGSLMSSAYLWRSNLLLRAQVAQWRAERVAAQASAYRTRAKSRSTPLPAGSATIQSPTPKTQMDQGPGNSNIPDAAGKTLEDMVNNEVVVSFGSVEQMGSSFASFFSSEQARRLRARAHQLGAADQSLSAEEAAQGQRQLAEIVGMLPEVEKFQDKPAEYGRFFKGLFQAGGVLTEAEANQIEALMRQRATEGINQGVNAGSKPQEGSWAWEMKRDAFNEETATQLKAILPAKAQETFPVDGPLMEFLEMDFDAAGISLPKR